MHKEDFRQIAHSGGTITIRVVTQPDGQRLGSIEFRHQRPVGSALFAVHVLPPGVPVATAHLGGMGSPIDPGPVPGNIMVYIVSDSHMMWGAECPRCGSYWRSKSPSKFCVSCRLEGKPHAFLTKAHHAYMQQYCAVFEQAQLGVDGDYIIDLDAVADAVSSVEKPPFYYAEESQQNQFKCAKCGCTVDILGRFGYCSNCGTRNDLEELKKTLEGIRIRINTNGSKREDCVRDAVSAFDSFVGQYVKELLAQIPMTKARRNRLGNARYHNVKVVRDELQNTFDIDIFEGIDDVDQEFAALMFLRRHVYEHNGGEADEDYIAQSGDTSVRLKQSLRETQESAHRTVGLVSRMAANLHKGFQEIIETS
jgi:hypothetical protein